MLAGAAFQSRDFLHEPPEGGNARRDQSSHAGQVGQGAPGTFPAGGYHDGAGGRSQICHHRQHVLAEQHARLVRERTVKRIPSLIDPRAAEQ